MRTYSDLSPDWRVRRQVNCWLRSHRPALSAAAWSQEFGRYAHCEPRLLSFLQQYLQRYSGIELSRVRPSDRLVEDLKFPLVCWFDWSWSLCDDFARVFNTDISDCFDETQIITVSDLLVFLSERVRCEAAVSSF
ncbi:MAG: hypothetical protein F6J97_06365 [Leptolyngbya sp. SIO4C1]|nr:hypothetical protein [Leptolyngbya sp. SIO4C1]